MSHETTRVGGDLAIPVEIGDEIILKNHGNGWQETESYEINGVTDTGLLRVNDGQEIGRARFLQKVAEAPFVEIR